MRARISLEVVYTFRTLWRQRFYTCAVIMTMGLGLGANAVLAAVLEALYLRPLPYVEGNRIALSGAVWQPELASPSAGGALASGPFAVAAGYRSGEGTVLVGAEALRVRMAAVSASFFDVFRDAPLRGRTLSGSDDTSRVGVVISQRLAAMLSSTTPASLVVNGVRRDVIGVMPASFEFPSRADLWILHDQVSTGFYGGARFLNTVVRLRDGVTIEAARGALPRQPDGAESEDALVSLRETLHRDLGSRLLLSEWMAALLLALSWVAVLHSQVLRISGRTAEFATRLALGARPRHLLALIWIESVLLYGGGALVALAMSALSAPYVSRALPERLAQTLSVGVSWRTMAATAGLTLACACIGSLVAAAKMRRLSGGAAGGSGARAIEGQAMAPGGASVLLVGLQVAFTTAAVVCTLLLWHSFAKVVGTEFGLDTAGLVAFRVELPADARGRQVVPLVEAALRHEPFVTSAGSTSHLPLRDVGGFLVPVSRSDEPASTAVPAHFRAASAGYFTTAGTAIIEGRGLAASSATGSPEIVVNERLARMLWPTGSAVGRRVRLPFDREHPLAEVVGVAASVKHFGLTEDAEPEIYAPIEKWQLPVMTVVVRTQEPFDAAVAHLRDVTRRVSPGVAVFDFVRVQDVLAASYRDRQLQSLLALLLTIVALLVAFTTLFAVVGLMLRSRAREVAIRLALGASRATVLRNMASRAALAAGGGLVVGLGLAWVAGRYLQSLLFQLPSSDPMSYVAACAVVGGCATLAAMEATRRCTRDDVLSTLR